MRKSTKGFYTVEAALILPIVIIAVFALSYLIRVESTWENVINGAADETQNCMLKGYDGLSHLTLKTQVRKRILDDNDNISQLKISSAYAGELKDSAVGAYKIDAQTSIVMPFNLGSSFKLEAYVKYRNFVGNKKGDGGIGRKAMETDSDGKAVVIFPQEGEKYHSEKCTYSVAKVHERILTDKLKSKHNPCGICKSKDMATGSVVYCFSGKGTAYHRASCRTIDRRTLTMDKRDAIKKGYAPCSKCGGG